MSHTTPPPAHANMRCPRFSPLRETSGRPHVSLNAKTNGKWEYARSDNIATFTATISLILPLLCFCRVRNRSDVTTICWNKGNGEAWNHPGGSRDKRKSALLIDVHRIQEHTHISVTSCLNLIVVMRAATGSQTKGHESSTCPNFGKIPNISLPGTIVVSH